MTLDFRRNRVAGFAALGVFVLGSISDPLRVDATPVVRAPASTAGRATKGQSATKKTGFNPAIFQTADAKAFLEEVRKQVERNWFPAKASNADVSMRFRVHRDGKVSWVESNDRSDVEAVNQSAEDTIYYGGNFPPIPKSLPEYIDIEVEYLSDYQPPSESGYARPANSKLVETGKLLDEATKERESGNYDRAIEKLHSALLVTPHDGRVRDALVKAYTHIAKDKPPEEAIKIYHKLLIVDPTRDNARAKLNELLQGIGKDPKDYKVRLALAREAVAKDQYDDAMAEYGEAWKLDKAHFPVIEVNALCKIKYRNQEVIKWESAYKKFNSTETKAMYKQALSRVEPIKTALVNYADAQNKLLADGTAAVDPKLEDELCTEVAGSKSKGQERKKDLLTVVSDEFPYNDFGSRSLKVKALADRKAQVSYLRHACPTQTIRWASNRIPLKLYVEESYHAPGYKPQFKGFVIKALQTWNAASGGRLPFEVVTDPFEANIEVRFTGDPNSAKMMRGNEQGVTHFMYYLSETDNCIVKSAKIYILTLDRVHLQPATDQLMESVCTHEIGHALGIAGHSPFYGDIMFPVLFADYFIPRQLTDRDCGTIKNLYQNYVRQKK